MNKKTLQNLALECIGLAAAAGDIIDIPIVIQRLASHIRHGRLHVLTLAMLSILDAGNHPSHPTSVTGESRLGWDRHPQCPTGLPQPICHAPHYREELQVPNSEF